MPSEPAPTHYLDGFFQAIHEADGTPVELLEVLRPGERFALVMTVEALFDQTPGPTRWSLVVERRRVSG